MQPEKWPVLIYQMGKVASSSLCEGLNGAKIAVAQTHFLGQQALSAMLEIYLKPVINAFFSTHIYGQLIANIRLTRLLLDQRHASEAQGGTSEKVKIISLSQDPLDWYRTEFVQNFDGYIAAIRAFQHDHAASVNDGDGDDVAAIIRGHELILHTLAQQDLSLPLQPPYAIKALLQPAFAANDQASLLPNGLNFFKPLVWFQRLFPTITGIDIFSAPKTTIGNGVWRFENSFCDALIIKYECLQEAMPAIAEFVGASRIRLPRSNISEKKPQYRRSHEAFQQLAIPASVSAALYASDYCKFFGYTERRRF